MHEPLRQFVEPLNRLPPHRIVRIVPHRAEGVVNRVQDFVGDGVIQLHETEHPRPRELFSHRPAQRVSVSVHILENSRQDVVQQAIPLVAPEKAGQHLTGKGGDAHAPHDLGGNVAQHPLHRRIFRRVQRSNEYLRAFVCQRTPAFGGEERLDQFFRDAPGTDQSGDPLRRDQLPLGETADIRGNALGIPGDDGRVRNRQAEGVSEQRRHRIPVGKRAHHRGLSEGSEPCKHGMRLLLKQGHDKQQRHEQQEPGCQGPHANIVLSLRRQGLLCSTHSSSPLSHLEQANSFTRTHTLTRARRERLGTAFMNNPG